MLRQTMNTIKFKQYDTIVQEVVKEYTKTYRARGQGVINDNHVLTRYDYKIPHYFQQISAINHIPISQKII